MKIIHCADIHLGAKISSFPKEISENRKMLIRQSFSRMIKYAKHNGIKIILLCGDVFDRDNPFKKDISFFYNAIESTPEIDFLYLKGNHDKDSEPLSLPNLKTFTSNWINYTYDNVVISGIELSASNRSAFYSSLSLDETKKNIVMMHGQLDSEINLIKLRDKNIDYLALGHIHSYSTQKIDNRGIAVYCGCLEGRGFDETGDKGFVIIDTDKNSHTFIPFSQNVIENLSVNVSNLTEGYSMAKRIRDTHSLNRTNIYQIELNGEVNADIEEFTKDIESQLQYDCSYVRVKDCTIKKIDYSLYENDNSLRGEFVRLVKNNPDLSEEDKRQIIVYGLRALEQREVDT